MLVFYIYFDFVYPQPGILARYSSLHTVRQAPAGWQRSIRTLRQRLPLAEGTIIDSSIRHINGVLSRE